jgi:uncharacterized protein (DUF1778 family)
MPLVQIDLTDEEVEIIDDAAKIERRSRKAQVTEAAIRDSRRVIEVATESEAAKP